jgi:hypothetical protein
VELEAMELPRHQASVALVVPVEMQLSTPLLLLLLPLVDSVVTVAMPQPEPAELVELAAPQLLPDLKRSALVEMAVSVALRPQEQLELAAPVAQFPPTARIPWPPVESAVSAVNPYLHSAASEVTAARQPALPVPDLAVQSAAPAGSAERQHQGLAASVALAVLLRRPPPAPTPTLARRLRVVLVEQAEQLPPADEVAPVAHHSLIATNGQLHLAAPEEVVARSAAWVDLVDLAQQSVEEPLVTVLQALPIVAVAVVLAVLAAERLAH